MATIQKRGDAHRAIIRRAGAKSLSQTFDSYEEAQAWADAVEERIAAGLAAKGEVITLKTPVARIVTRFVQEVTPTKRGARSEAQMMGALLQRFPAIFAKSVAQFSSDDIETIKAARLKGSRDYAAVAPGTVIRELGMLSGCFTHAIKKWKAPWVVNPVHGVDRPRAPAHRTQRVNAALRAEVCASLDYVEAEKPVTPKQWVAWAFCFALETAMRRGEVLTMEWSDYDAAARSIHIPVSKNGYARDVPISARARLLLNALGQDGQGRIVPINECHFSNVWNLAKKGTSRAHLHFHDARHEATSQFAKVVHNVLELAAITGHRDLKMLKIYFNPEARDLAALLDRLAA
jgi:integrase